MAYECVIGQAKYVLLTQSSTGLMSGFSGTYNFWSSAQPITVILVNDDVGTGELVPPFTQSNKGEVTSKHM
jgi:hypothetical protein